MTRNQKIPMDGKDIARFLTSTIGSFIQDRLINRDQRLQHKDQCAERLAADGGDRSSDIRYSDQAVLANLDWGIDALEEAISTSNLETKLARLDHAERMLHVCAMLDAGQSTAGVPNSYLSAWAHLNLAYLSKLRSSVRDAVVHVLEMFAVEPFFSRIDFAPELWEPLFLPHMGSIVGWYSEARHRIVMEAIPDSSDLSLTVDFDDQLFNESVILTVRPDQADKLRELEKLYGESLDHNTRMYARYYKDCLNGDPTAGKKGMPLMLPPIAEPPMTPLHEVSRLIPNFVKFGPILPKNSGFAPVLKEQDTDDSSAPSSHRLSVTPNSAQELEESAERIFKEPLLEEDEDESDSDGSDVDMDSEIITRKIVALDSIRTKEDKDAVSKIQPSMKRDQSSHPNVFSPVDSPNTPSPKVLSPKVVASSKKGPEKLLRLLSIRLTNASPKLFSPADSPKIPSPKTSSPKQREEPEPLLRLVSGRSTSVPVTPRCRSDLNIILGNSDGEVEVQKSCRSLGIGSTMPHTSNNSLHNECVEEVSQSSISLPSSEKLMPQTRPPKDFVCPITGQLFGDPVTLETGQTYERRAIQEWLSRGHTSCPITRQSLSAPVLPKTNFVLKRVITSWMEQYPDLAQEFSYSETQSSSLSPTSSRGFPLDSITLTDFDLPLRQTANNENKGDKRRKRFMRAAVSTSPTSVISQAASEAVINGLKPYTVCLCTSEDLQECEAAVLTIASMWKDSKANPGIHDYLCKQTVVNGFLEILSASINREALRASIFVLSELISVDESVGETLNSLDSDFDCLATLLKTGLVEAAVLIYQLRPAFSLLSNHNLIPSLVQVISNKGDQLDDFQLIVDPKDAAIGLLEQILLGGDENSGSLHALNVISANGLPALIKCLDRTEGRLSVVSILLSCMRADRVCRNLIANKAELAPVLELFHAGNDSTKGVCIDFISELICLNRRTFCNQILQIIKDEGAFSTMHTFLVYLQMAPMEQQPSVASLLLQLDLLVEPRKMSIYREEAIEAIIEALQRKDFPVCQIIALDTLSSLSGRLSASGKSLTEAWLLKIAGVDLPYSNIVKEERMQMVDDESVETMEEEEKAMSVWEKRVAFVLANHESGAIFKALEECLRSNSLEMAKSCLVIATWLAHMLSSLPDTGMRTIASKCLLGQFINVLLSSRNLEEKVLATLALKSFINDPDALNGLGMYAKSICKPLRKLKKCSVVVADTLKAVMTMPSVDPTDFWSCTDVVEIDSSANGEVLSLVHSKGRVFSSHSDGIIKVWDAGRRGLRLIQEARGHSKAVTCLYIPSSGDKLYSGSHDKTIRVWSIETEEIQSVQVHDMKEPVHCYTANTNLACFTSQGTGAKVYNRTGALKHVNFKQNVKCLAMTEENVYCGCTAYSIQEVDLHKWTSNTLFSGTRKLLGKQTIHALCIHDGILFAGGSSVDGMAGKAFSLSTKTAIGSFSTAFDIHCIAVNNDFVFTGTKSGVIEVWLRDRLTRVALIKVGGGANTKVTSLALDSDGEMLFSGSSDGKIQVWALD